MVCPAWKNGQVQCSTVLYGTASLRLQEMNMRNSTGLSYCSGHGEPFTMTVALHPQDNAQLTVCNKICNHVQ